jgi:hypothetical protein
VLVTAALLHPNLIANIADAGYVLGDILSHPLLMTRSDRAAQNHFAALDDHLDLGGIYVRMICQPLIDIFLNSLV